MKLFLLLFISYLIGNLLTGSLISKLFYRREIGTEGSGNPGARNSGRLFGKRAFIATFLGGRCERCGCGICCKLVWV